MVALLVILALIGWAVGALLLTQATYGVGVLAAACLLGILARVAQAGEQHRETLHTLRTGLNVPTAPADPPRAGGWACACGYTNSATVFDCTKCGAERPRVVP